MDLILVSGTESYLDKLVQASVRVQLDQYRQLPQPFKVSPWKHGPVSALRDRLMIEWVFCQRDSMKVLHEIITAIDAKLEPSSKRQTTQQCTLIVGVSCSTGMSLSPCFVERLHEHYCSFPPFDGLKVTRSHLQADSPTPSSLETDCHWQQLPSSSRYCRHKKEFQNVQQLKHLTTSMDWSPLPALLNTRIEQAFLKDPLNSKVVLGDVLVDFVDGTLFTKSTGQKSFIRCSVQPQKASVIVRELTNENYQVFARNYEAAGILPYSAHPVTKEAIFLVGQLTYDGGSWCDFGGLKSGHIFRETPAQTAARECYEETLGVLGSSSHLLGCLRNYIQYNSFKVINENSNYVGHFLWIPFDHYPAQFDTLTIKGLAEGKELEVNAIRWLSLSAIRTAVRSTMTSSHSIEVNPIDEKDGSFDATSLVRLRIEFAKSLCIAEKLGVLDSIEYIVEQRYCHTSSSDKSTHDQQEDLVGPLTGISLEEEANDEPVAEDSLDTADQHLLLPSADSASSTAQTTPLKPTHHTLAKDDSEDEGQRRRGKRTQTRQARVKLFGMGAGRFLNRKFSTTDV